jgi:hypothetical protein
MKEFLKRTGGFWRAEFFSPKFFLVRAVSLVALFLIAHLAGLRDYTAFLSGTEGIAGAGMRLSAFYGVVYIVLYVGCILVAPILFLTCGLLVLLELFRNRDQRS